MSKQAGAAEKPKVAPTVTKPDSDPSDVKVPMGTVGDMCTAFGEASFPLGVTIIGVYALTKPGSDQTATNAELTNPNNSRLFSMSGTGNWSFPSTGSPNSFVRATAGASLGETAPNTFFAATTYVNYASGGYSPILEVTKVNFEGRKVATCSYEEPKAKGKSAAPARAPTASSAATRVQEAHPSDSDCGWLLYRGIPVDFVGLGCTLMRNGAPLSANHLAVAATNVWWAHGPAQNEFVYRASGNGRAGHEFSMFPDVTQNGIVLSQLTFLGGFHLDVRPVTSECRERPDYFSVDPTRPVHVQVNFDNTDSHLRFGSFDLWVKVVD